MANLIVTNVCNLKCPYCFAGQYLETAKQATDSAFIGLATFQERLDFLDRSGINEIRLIGGEPTLHPQFPELIEQAHQRGKRIVVFSHGLMPDRALACLEALSPQACIVIVNMNATRHAEGPSQQEVTKRKMTLMRLGDRASLGFNIYTPAFDMDFLLTLIQEAHCQPSIRVGLAQPILSGDNAFLHPKQYRLVGAELARFAQRAARAGVKLDLDCGFVRCMFSNDEIAHLREAGTQFEAHCNPILDIDISGRVIHCFPLTNHVELAPNTGLDAGAMRAALDAQTKLFREAGIYRECSTCPIKLRGECTGGCLANTLRRFEHPPIRLAMPQTVFHIQTHLES